jgi:hypothetical protein
MVTPLDAVEQQVPVEVEDLGDADDGSVEQEASDEVDGVPPNGQPPVEAPAPPSDSQPDTITQAIPPQQPNMAPEEIHELSRRRQADVQRQWEQGVMKRAQQIERKFQEQGADPQSSRQVARQYVAHQKELKDQESKAMDLIGFVEGRQNAALQFALTHKLLNKQAIDDIQTLLKFRTPQEMELEARRMSQLRSQAIEISRLKQGRVVPQTFDNSQGAAEASSNDHRLLDAYNSGDRSDAAVKAARRLALGL